MGNSNPIAKVAKFVEKKVLRPLFGGGSRSAPVPRQEENNAANFAAVQAAAEAARGRAENEALQRRIAQLEQQNTQNQQQLSQTIQRLTETTQQNNSAELQSMRQAQEAEMNRLRQEMTERRSQMETNFAEKMKQANEEGRKELQAQREQHRREQEQQEREAKEQRIQDLIQQKRVIADHLVQIGGELERTKSLLNEEEGHLNNIQNCLILEMDARSRFQNPRIDRNYKKIVMIGNTGDGKSTLGNRLWGDSSRKGNTGPFHANHGADSVTQTIEVAFVDDPPFCVVDTPGGGESRGKERERIHATNLVDFLNGIGEVAAFALVRNAKNKRLSLGDQEVLARLQELLGSGWWNNTILVFTNVDDEDDEEDLQETQHILPRKIGETLGLDRMLVDSMPIVGIGKRNYEAKRMEIFEKAVGCNHGRPFVCEELVAPVEKRQEEYDGQQRIVNNLHVEMRTLMEKRGGLQAQQEHIEEGIRELRN